MAILSVPEGDDKPLKYPLMFTVCDLLVINKTDYLGLSDFDPDRLAKRARALNGTLQMISVSCRTAEGFQDWITWVGSEIVGGPRRPDD